jgi:hypothetical protein
MKIEKLKVHIYWTSFLLAIQKSLTQEYYYYVSGIIKNKDKISGILKKFDDYYKISESKDERYRRFKDGYSVSIIHLLKIENNLAFIIMTRMSGVKGLFFERENFADARDKKHRVNINRCYEFIRVNKESYDINTNKILKTNEVWTVDLTNQEKINIYEKFNMALLKRDYMIIKQICYGLNRLIGFSAVRDSYIELKDRISKRFIEFHRSQFEPKYNKLDELYKLPKKICYIKYTNSEFLNIKQILN